MNQQVHPDMPYKGRSDYSPNELPEFNEDTNNSAQMQSVGEILNNPDQTQLFKQQGINPNQLPLENLEQHTRTSGGGGGLRMTYRNAVRYGFIAALLLAVVAAIALA